MDLAAGTAAGLRILVTPLLAVRADVASVVDSDGVTVDAAGLQLLESISLALGAETVVREKLDLEPASAPVAGCLRRKRLGIALITATVVAVQAIRRIERLLLVVRVELLVIVLGDEVTGVEFRRLPRKLGVAEVCVGSVVNFLARGHGCSLGCDLTIGCLFAIGNKNSGFCTYFQSQTGAYNRELVNVPRK